MPAPGQPPYVSQASTSNPGPSRPRAQGQGEPRTYPLQPRPIGLLTAYLEESDQTVIVRNWREGDPARCRFCPRCTANACGSCLVVAYGYVPDASAALYRFVPG